MTQTRAELEKLKIPDLRKLCKEYKVLAYSKLNKKDLVDRVVVALSAASSGTVAYARQTGHAGAGTGTTSHQHAAQKAVLPEHVTTTETGRASLMNTPDLLPASSSLKNMPSSVIAPQPGGTISRAPSVLALPDTLPATPSRAEPTIRGVITVAHNDAARTMRNTPLSSSSRTVHQTMLPPASATQPPLPPTPSTIDTRYLNPSHPQATPDHTITSAPVPAPAPTHTHTPAPAQAPTARRRPKRQMVEMTEADYAELERMKRPKRTGVSNSQSSASGNQALQKNLSTMSSGGFAPDHLRGTPSLGPQAQCLEGKNQRPVRDPSQPVVLTSPGQRMGMIRNPSQATAAPSPLARSIRTEEQDRATTLSTTLMTDTPATSGPQMMIVSSELPFTPVKANQKDQTARYIPSTPVLPDLIDPIMPPQTPSAAIPAKPKPAKKLKNVTLSAQEPKAITTSAQKSKPDVPSKSTTRRPAKEKKLSTSSFQTVSGNASASEFAPLKIVRPPVIQEKQSDPPVLVTLELAEKPLEFPAGCTVSDIDKIIKPSFLERLYRANKAAAGRPVPDDEMAFDGLATNMLDGTESAESLNVAMRFVVARIHTRFQLGEWKDPVGFAPVQRVKKLCDGIWVAETLEMTVDRAKGESETSISKTKGKRKGQAKGKPNVKAKNIVTTEDTPTNQTRVVRYLLVGETGDVISRFEQPIDIFTPTDIALGNFDLRPDWRAYLQSKIDISRVPSLSATLLDRVRTKNPDEYPQGISRTWLKRMEHDIDSDLVRLAKRYVLGNVVLNSISGELLSAMQMDAIWAGKAGAEVRPKDWKTVSLFLPESHQVEAVGFSITSNGKKLNLHPAIGLVARRNGEDLVLRTTGQVVGSVEQGVSELYKHVLGCDDRGLAVGHDEAERLAQKFWSGFDQVPEDER